MANIEEITFLLIKIEHLSVVCCVVVVAIKEVGAMLNMDVLKSQMFDISEGENGGVNILTLFKYEDSDETVHLSFDPSIKVLSDDGGLTNILLDYADADDFRDYVGDLAPEYGVRYEAGCLVTDCKDFVESFNAMVQASIALSARVLEQIKTQRESIPECFVGEEDE